MYSKKNCLNSLGKIFLFGEYAVLKHHAAIICCFPPAFSLTWQEGKTENPFHQESPAGLLYNENKQKLLNQHFHFIDPHAGKGGFGASSAQFALLYFFLNQIDEIVGKEVAIWEAWKKFRTYFPTFKAQPSGADLIAQSYCLLNNISTPTFFYVDIETKNISVFSSFFPNTELWILRTGKKLATHEHLHNLKLTNAFQPLHKIVLTAANFFEKLAVKKANAQAFAKLFTQYNAHLKTLGLLDDHTQTLHKEVSKLPGVLGAKGCGALGADALAIMVEKTNSKAFSQEIQKFQLEIFPLFVG